MGGGTAEGKGTPEVLARGGVGGWWGGSCDTLPYPDVFKHLHGRKGL